MLFRLSADQNLTAIQAMLDACDVEADCLRQTAIAARNGSRPTSLAVASADETYDGLLALADEIDAALSRLPAGDALFSPLLKAQTKALALLESVGRSRDMLADLPVERVRPPVRIGRESQVAAQ